MLIKKKFDYEIYDQAKDIFNDVSTCQNEMRKLQSMLKGENTEEDDSDEEGIDERSNFLASEIPLLLHQAFLWMNTKMEQKQKDKIWLDNFVKDCN